MTGNKQLPAFWSMGGTIHRSAKPIVSKSAGFRAKIQSSLKSGDFNGALALAEQAVSAADTADTRLALATVCRMKGEFDRAESNYQEVLRRQPARFAALLGLGQLKLRNGKVDEAIDHLENALKAAPSHVDARHLLARAYGMGGRTDRACALFESLVVEAPRNPDIWSGYGRALAAEGAVDKAISAYQKAEQLNPSDDAIQQGLGAAYLSIGQLDKAEKHLREATRLRPDRGMPLHDLARLKPVGQGEIDEAERQLALLPSNDRRRIPFLSTIAVTAEKAGDSERCFKALAETLAIRQAHAKKPYDPAGETAIADRVCGAIGGTPKFELQAARPRPIFILGMPRSGSTLTEQVLARHPMVSAVGECLAMHKAINSVPKLGKFYPEALLHLGVDDAKDLRAAYYANLPDFDSSLSCVADKTLGNVFSLPAIESIFPDAKIVWCRRHPMDICWSIINLPFGNSMTFATRIEDICHQMLLQHRLQEAWSERGTVPTLHLFYEELVENFDSGVRSLVGFADLDWSDRCLRPQESGRAVRTASAGQVHQPVSKSAVGRWKPFASQLDYAVQALKPLIELHEAELTRRGIAYN